jgi:hypothetical protein
MPSTVLPLTLTCRGLTYSIRIDGSESLSDLQALIEEATGIRDSSIKVLVPGKKALQLDSLDPQSLKEAGKCT